LMSPFGDGTVNHSGTFNASVMATSAILATLDVLTENPPYERVSEYGTTLQGELLRLADSHGLPLRTQGLPMAFHASFGARAVVNDYRALAALDSARYATFAYSLAQQGVWVAARGIWYVSAAHGEQELAATIERVDKAMSEAQV